MGKTKILIVEDDRDISKLIKYNLEKEGYSCEAAASGEDAFKVIGKHSFGLIILDIMLPGMDGLEVCRHIRKNNTFSDIPVIMLTAKGEEVDRIVGFELGADDYMVKPFSPRELILRIKAILKRGKKKPDADKATGTDTLKAGNIIIDFPRHKVTVKGKKIELTLMEFNLLATLIERAGRVQPRDRLLDDVWGITSNVTTRTVDTHVKRLREKLGKKDGAMIETVRGIGYKFAEI